MATRKNKVAFMFLTIGNTNNDYIWNEFFQYADKEKYIVIAHSKKITTDFLKDYQVPTKENTKWCGSGLVLAVIRMLEQGILDKDVSHFCLLCESALPVTCFDNIYDILQQSNKGYCQGQEKEKNKIELWQIFPRILAEEIICNYKTFHPHNTSRKYLRGLNNFDSGCQDELWFSMFINTRLEKDLEDYFIYNKVYFIDWGNENRGMVHPKCFTIKEYYNLVEDLEGLGYLFIRKVSKFKH